MQVLEYLLMSRQISIRKQYTYVGRYIVWQAKVCCMYLFLHAILHMSRHVKIQTSTQISHSTTIENHWHKGIPDLLRNVRWVIYYLLWFTIFNKFLKKEYFCTYFRSFNFEMSLWCLQFSQKTNLETQIFALAIWAEIFCSFFGRIEKIKMSFRN